MKKNIDYRNMMSEEYSKDVAGCLIPAAILFVAFVVAALIIIFF